MEQTNKKPVGLYIAIISLALFSGLLIYLTLGNRKELGQLKEIYKETKDSLQAVRVEANILSYENDSLTTIVKDANVITKYNTKIVYVNTKTNEAVKTIYAPTSTDSLITSEWTRQLMDSTFRKGSSIPYSIK